MVGSFSFLASQNGLKLSPMNTSIMWAFYPYNFVQFCDGEFLFKKQNFMYNFFGTPGICILYDSVTLTPRLSVTRLLVMTHLNTLKLCGHLGGED